MNDRRFLNRYQPQTLVSATLLCYIQAVFGAIFGADTSSALLAVFIVLGLGLGGYGIANEKRWGYALALAAAVLQVGGLLAWQGIHVLEFPWILSLMFDVLLVGLLVHPQSREYQRIWFK